MIPKFKTRIIQSLNLTSAIPRIADIMVLSILIQVKVILNIQSQCQTL
jgi:hypothetical protein